MPNEKVLIPGMASYMQDVDVDIDLSVGAPEEVATEAEETADVATEVSDTDAEVQEDATEAEMMFRRFDEIERMETYVAQYGVDRPFLALNSYPGSLLSALVTMPNCESFDAVGNVQSPESIACQEGFAEAAKSVWEFIKRMATKIKEFVGRLVEAIRARFTSLDKNIGRYRAAMSGRADAPELLKGVKTAVYTRQQLEKMGAKNVKAIVDQVKKAAEDLKKCGEAVGAGKKTEADGFASAADTIVNSIVESGKKMKKDRAAAKKVSLDKISWDEAKGMLDTAADMKSVIDMLMAAGAILKTTSEQFIKMADGMKNRGDEGGKDLASAGRKGSALLNRVSSAFSGILSQANWLASQYVYTAGMRITRGSKKSD